MNNEQDKTEFELFDAAFAEATGDLPAAEAVAAVETPAPAEAATESVTPATAAEAVAAVETPAPAEAATESVTPATAEAVAAVETPAPAADSDYQKQTVDLLEQLVKKGTSPVTSAAASSTGAADSSQAQDGGTDPEPFTLSDEQKALLKTYDEEWPEVARASELRTQMAIGEAVGALVKQLRQELAPVVQHYVKTQGDGHFSAIKTAHEDFDALKPQVQEWISKQPTGLRTAYQQIAQTGSAEDVIGLFNIYKKTNGIGVTPKESSSDARVTVVTT
ncbi:MAG: hypothetical protein ACREF9_06435, partial [Opitutaceae bacterium]